MRITVLLFVLITSCSNAPAPKQHCLTDTECCNLYRDC